MATIEINKLDKSGKVAGKLLLDMNTLSKNSTYYVNDLIDTSDMKMDSDNTSVEIINSYQIDSNDDLDFKEVLENDIENITQNNFSDGFGDFKWKNTVVRGLLFIRKEMDYMFQHQTMKKNKIWDLISAKLNGSYNVQTTGMTCSEKFKNLQQTYKRNKEKEAKEELIHWPYFNLWAKLFGEHNNNTNINNCFSITSMKTEPVNNNNNISDNHINNNLITTIDTLETISNFSYDNNKYSIGKCNYINSSQGTITEPTSSSFNIYNRSIGVKNFKREQEAEESFDKIDRYSRIMEKKFKLWEKSNEIEEKKLEALNKLNENLLKLLAKTNA